jgi:multidrug efflux pump subunit AcrB
MSTTTTATPRINGVALKDHDISLEDEAEVVTRAVDKTVVPNWVLVIVATVFMTLVGFVYTTIQKDFAHQQDQITDLKNNLSTEQVRLENTREQLIAHGWTVDDSGKIHAPAKEK